MTKNSFYAVSGRFHGDDEATTLPLEAPSRDAAVRHFKHALCQQRGLDDDKCAEVMGDAPAEQMQVYIDTVLCSDSRIEVV